MGKIPSIQQYDLASLVVPMSPVVGEKMLYLLMKRIPRIDHSIIVEEAFITQSRAFITEEETSVIEENASINGKNDSSIEKGFHHSIIVKEAFILEM